MAWVEISRGYTALFRQRGWDSAALFLEWTGILVNCHRRRKVEQVSLPPSLWRRGTGGEGDRAPEIATFSTPIPHVERDATFFLKKEHAVSWRARFRNAWHGFGWCATVVREAAILQAARAAGIGCPEVVAFGEDERRAFLLVRDESAMTELRAFLPTLVSDRERNRLADALGRDLARLHDAGFDHPDLFAKHILVSRIDTAYRFCILDWARARRCRAVSWRLRCRDLAALDATLHAALASDRLRLRCLRAYWRALSAHPPFARLARQIRREGERLRGQRNIRESGQLSVPAGDQQFVPVCGGRLLVVRSYFEKCGGCLADWLTILPEPGTPVEDFSLTVAGASGSEKLCLQSWPRSVPAWEIPPLAHTLFRLQRFGVPAPRLLGVGASSAHVFVLTESAATMPFEEAFAKAPSTQRRRMLRQAGWIVRQIHEAGYFLPAGDAWARRLGVNRATGDVVLAKVEPLPRGETSWQELAPLEFNRQKIRLSRTEQLRFLGGYLGRHGAGLRIKKVFLRTLALKERQPAA